LGYSCFSILILLLPSFQSLGYAVKDTWNISQNTQENKEKIQALSLAKECYSMKLDLLTNSTVVEDAMRFVSKQDHEYEKTKKSNVAGARSDDLDYLII
jgi:hypothetical protein